ncbi:hypothetical protein [Lysobacter capsici]|uniref:hypothetical protein n=1 Tax=Lysobacter capsici TaxID=435897 RepID=UPI001C002605|nr:hypothetical protein [Lysobacter capsici]QWF18289.1 hypothetical protein KME82_05860 [Lysobacter capsici]
MILPLASKLQSPKAPSRIKKASATKGEHEGHVRTGEVNRAQVHPAPSGTLPRRAGHGEIGTELHDSSQKSADFTLITHKNPPRAGSAAQPELSAEQTSETIL